MTRRERLERRAELRREWAEKRQAKAAAAFAHSRELVSHIPMGQPILIGHHSEKMHRRTLERSDNAMRAGCESQSMAHHHESKADGIERQLERSIFSDDPDATEQLQAKIDKAQKLQDAMTAANKIVRQKPKNEATPEKTAALLALGLNETQARQLFVADFCGRFGFPSYALTNNNANIRRMKERIGQIQRDAERKQAADNAHNGILIEGADWVRITFNEKPSRTVLDSLKVAGFRWGSGYWTGKREHIPQSVRDMAGIEAWPGSVKWWTMERGFKVFIRCSRVYCWTVGSIAAMVADVDNGRWMENHDIHAAPWECVTLTADQRANFEAADRDCYCYQGVDRCDFCNSTRTPDGAPSSNGEAFWKIEG